MKIKEYLEENGMKRCFLAKKLGITKAMLSAWVNGRTVPSMQSAWNVEKVTKGVVRMTDWIIDKG